MAILNRVLAFDRVIRDMRLPLSGTEEFAAVRGLIPIPPAYTDVIALVAVAVQEVITVRKRDLLALQQSFHRTVLPAVPQTGLVQQGVRHPGGIVVRC